jgi:hypothetical protein
MDNATDTPPVIENLPAEITPPVDNQVIIVNSDIFLPLESSLTFSTLEATTNIDVILNNYFEVFTTEYLLLLIGFGISAILIYTIYGYLEQ